MTAERPSVVSKLNRFGTVLRFFGAARFYHDGDAVGFVWRPWHPLSWIAMPLAFALACLVQGVPTTWRRREDVGLRVAPYFTERGIDPFDGS